MNWGYKILTTIMLFITVMATMVTIAMRQNNDLVDDEYYVRELKHQELIDAEHNLRALEGGQIVLLNENDTISIRIPRIASGNVTRATITFIRPSDKTKDRTMAFAPGTNGTMAISNKLFEKGQYTVRLSWKSNNIPYYHEQSFYIN